MEHWHPTAHLGACGAIAGACIAFLLPALATAATLFLAAVGAILTLCTVLVLCWVTVKVAGPLGCVWCSSAGASQPAERRGCCRVLQWVGRALGYTVLALLWLAKVAIRTVLVLLRVRVDSTLLALAYRFAKPAWVEIPAILLDVPVVSGVLRLLKLVDVVSAASLWVSTTLQKPMDWNCTGPTTLM